MPSSLKVLAFDSWTEGAVHVERLVEAFDACQMELLFLHIGSWGHDLNRPAEERIGQLRVRDISYYGGRSFDQILELERPDLVLFLSLTSFAHRAFNRYCAARSIPTFHLYHGLVTVQSTATARLNPVNLRRQISLGLERAPKNIRQVLPLYARSLWDTKAPVSEWFRLLGDVWRRVVGRAYGGVAARDAACTAVGVYTAADIRHAIARYRAQPGDVHVVGNPDLINMGVAESDLGAALADTGAASTDVVYIDTALVAAGAVFDNEDDFVSHLIQTRDTLKSAGLRMVVKLHPSHFRTAVPDRLRQREVAQCTNGDFLAVLRHSRGCIVEPSSAAIIPALLGVPMLLAQFGKLSKQGYGDVLTSYPRARHARTLDDVAALLRELADPSTVQAVHEWIRVNAGPLPSHDMPRRVAAVCRNLVGPAGI